MSHFCSVKTKIMDEVCLRKAIEDCGYKVIENTEVKSYEGEKQKVDFALDLKSKYGVGFKQTQEGFTVVADWWGVGTERIKVPTKKEENMRENTFMEGINQRYAYRKTLSALEEQGFTLAEETLGEEQEICLTVRQW